MSLNHLCEVLQDHLDLDHQDLEWDHRVWDLLVLVWDHLDQAWVHQDHRMVLLEWDLGLDLVLGQGLGPSFGVPRDLCVELDLMDFILEDQEDHLAHINSILEDHMYEDHVLQVHHGWKVECIPISNLDLMVHLIISEDQLVLQVHPVHLECQVLQECLMSLRIIPAIEEEMTEDTSGLILEEKKAWIIHIHATDVIDKQDGVILLE